LAETQPYEDSKDLTKAKPNFESSLAVVGFTILLAYEALLRTCNVMILAVGGCPAIKDTSSDRDRLSQTLSCLNSFPESYSAFLRPDTGKQSPLQQGSAQETLSPPSVDPDPWVLSELTCSTS